MLLGPLGPRDLLVGDVPHEPVAKAVLDFAGDGAPALAAHELPALERVQALVERPALASERSEPERPTDDGRVAQELLHLAGKGVEARGYEPLHRLGQDDVVGPLVEHARELLGVQRVAAGVLEQPCL